MPIRLPEVSAVLALVFALVMAKHVPLFDAVPLTRITGIVCFAFAIFLALRLFEFEIARIRAEE